jgi:hypothetical protein
MLRRSGEPVRMDFVPWLVIADSLDPPLECPRCGRVFLDCSLKVSKSGIECSRCAESFPVWRFQRPPGLSASDWGWSWRIDVSTRSLRTVGVAAFVCLAPLATMLHLAQSGRELNVYGTSDPVGDLGWILGGSLAGLIMAGAGALAYALWGRYSVAVEGSELTVFRGVATVGTRSVFPISDTREVRIERVVADDGVEKHLIRIVGEGSPVEFGDTLTGAQRIWIALFLLEKACAH